jgi:NAD(P)-dependent dehydrogenase (short-subunit alcohol dehydrogenase family)
MKTSVLITGATGAIGKATALELAKTGAHLLLLARNGQALQTVKSEIEKTSGNQNVDLIEADLSEPDSVRKAVETINNRTTALSALVNTAAVFKSKRTLNSKGHEITFMTNHIGPFILTNALLPLLKNGKPSRIVTVSAPSFAKINFDDLNAERKYSAGFSGSFGASKMMNIMFTYALARRLEGSGVSCSVYHPGLVKSTLTKEMPAFLNFIFHTISSGPEKAAKTLAKLAIDPVYRESNGTFYSYQGKLIQSNAYSHNKEIQEKLWDISSRY